MAGVSEGQDADVVREVSEALVGLSDRLGEVEQTGTALLAHLEDVWAGPDLDGYASSWQSYARPQLAQASGALRELGTELGHQADAQEGASTAVPLGPADADPRPPADDHRVGHVPAKHEKSLWGKLWDGTKDVGRGVWNHVGVPAINGLANFGEAMLENPLSVLEVGAGVLLIDAGLGMEAPGVVLDATGVGAVVGVPINIAGIAMATAGVGMVGHGGNTLLNEASKNSNQPAKPMKAPKQGSQGRAGEKIPESHRPDTVGKNWDGRVSNNGNGRVWQRPGAEGNADSVRIQDPTSKYPDGYVRFYNKDGQPIDLEGKPSGPDKTHIPVNPDGTYPVPKGWNP